MRRREGQDSEEANEGSDLDCGPRKLKDKTWTEIREIQVTLLLFKDLNERYG